MKIYENEKHLQMQSNTVAYTAEILQNFKLTDTQRQELAAKANISVENFSEDLYPILSLLVSSVWNANDDVFSVEEIWRARHTPKHHPINIEHDQLKVIGNIIDVWPVDDDHKVISENTNEDELPEKIHLINSGVLYTKIADDEFRDTIENLIEEIKAGEKYVSMEAVFTDFDYVICKSDDCSQASVINRNEETSFLTKHLRAYGGKGVYENRKLGRLLKNITFIGKGIVARPANKDSVIFNREQVFDLSIAKNNTLKIENGVILFTAGNTNVEKENMSEEQTKALQKEIDALVAENKGLKAEAEKVKAQKFEQTIAGLETEVKQLTEAKEVLSQEKADLESKAKELESVKSELEAKSTKVQELEVEIAKRDADLKSAARKNILVEAGLEAEDAEKIVAQFIDLDDEKWQTVAEMKVDYLKTRREKEEAEKKAKQAKAGETDLSTEQDDSATAGNVEEDNETEQEQTIADMQAAIAAAMKIDLEK